MVPYDAGDRVMVTPDLKESIGARNSGKITEEQFADYKENICFSCGTCSMYGTANTMGVFAEVLGLCPMGSTTMLSCSAAKVRQARTVGERIVELVGRGSPPRSFMTRASLTNGILHVSATGGSTNFVMHVMAIARAAGVELDLEEFDAIQERVPVVAKFKPSSRYNMTDYHRAGRRGRLPAGHRDYLELDVPMAFGGTLRELLDRPAPPADPAVIHPRRIPWPPPAASPSSEATWPPRGRW